MEVLVKIIRQLKFILEHCYTRQTNSAHQQQMVVGKTHSNLGEEKSFNFYNTFRIP